MNWFSRRDSFARIALVVATLLVVATGCGSPVDQRSLPTTNGLIDALANDAVFGPSPRTNVPSEALCIAQSVQSSLGTERLVDLGITIENPSFAAVIGDLKAKELATYMGILDRCVGLAEPGASSAPTTSTRNDGDDSNGASGEGGADPIIADLANALMLGSDALTSNRAEASCIAERLFNWQGADGIGRLTEEHTLSNDTASSIAGIMYQCMDLEASFVSMITQDQGDISNSEATCVAAEVGPNGLAWLFADGVLAASIPEETQTKVDAALLAGFRTCADQ